MSRTAHCTLRALSAKPFLQSNPQSLSPPKISALKSRTHFCFCASGQVNLLGRHASRGYLSVTTSVISFNDVNRPKRDRPTRKLLRSVMDGFFRQSLDPSRFRFHRFCSMLTPRLRRLVKARAEAQRARFQSTSSLLYSIRMCRWRCRTANTLELEGMEARLAMKSVTCSGHWKEKVLVEYMICLAS